MKRGAVEVGSPTADDSGVGSKRARMTLEESRDLVQQADALATSPIERMELAHRFFSTVSQRHAHGNETRSDLAVPSAVYFLNDSLSGACPDWVERVLEASGGDNKEIVERGFHKALGVQQYQCVSDAILGAAVAKTVFDPKRDLQCLYCGVRALDERGASTTAVRLFTVASERKTRCKHPRTVELGAAWAVDPTTKRHPFESTPLYGPDGHTVVGREGTAICHLCLWTRQIARDGDLMDSLMTWADFTRLVHQDWLQPKDAHTRRICSCLYHAPGEGEEGAPPCGTICLFRLCRVAVTPDPNGLVGHDTTQPYAKWDSTVAQRVDALAQQRGYYTLDDPDLPDVAEAVNMSYFQRILNLPRPAAAVVAPPAVNFDDPAACFAFMQQNKSTVDAFFKAMEKVTNYYGPSIHIARPQKSSGRLDCRACGHTGHAGQKKCLFVIGAVQERQAKGSKGSGGQAARMSLADHILQNVETFGSEQRDSLLAIQEEHRWEIDEIMHRVGELLDRRRRGITTTVIPGPDPKFIGHNPSADQRRKPEAPRCTPVVPLKTLAECTLDMIMRGSNMELFLDLKFLANLVAKMHLLDLDTTDVRHLVDWNRALTMQERNDAALACINLHSFAKRITATYPPPVPSLGIEAFVVVTPAAPVLPAAAQAEAGEEEGGEADGGRPALELSPLNMSRDFEGPLFS